MVRMCLHGVSICQVANSCSHSRKRHAKGSRPAGVIAPGCLRRFYKRSVVYCNPDCNSCRRSKLRNSYRRVRTMLARGLRQTARRASGTLGSFSPPMNRVRYTRRTCSTPRAALRQSRGPLARREPRTCRPSRLRLRRSLANRPDNEPATDATIYCRT
jgi:hypothetical protein